VLRALSGLKRKMFCTLLIVGLLVPALPIAAFAAQGDIPGDSDETIVWNLLEDDTSRFTQLVALAGVAGIDGSLDDCEFGPVTLFAPTNAAFGAWIDSVGDDGYDELVNDEEALADFLLYHAIPNRIFSTDLPAVGESISVETLNGQEILIEVVDGDPLAVRINGSASVIEVDYEACNGVIHVIDEVLVPEAEEECQTIAEIAAADGRFTTLLAAAGIAGLDDELADPDFGPVTLFAPTDSAFAALQAALGEDAWNALLADPDALANVLLYHLLAGEVYAADLPAPGNSISVATLNGEEILIEVSEAGVTINGVAMVIQTDIEACNGVIHVIDAVLVPEGDEAPPVPDVIVVPGLPTTGIGPDQSLPWQALVLVALSLGLAYTALRKYVLVRD
jgi:transforming growth factor-beta-induced protein